MHFITTLVHDFYSYPTNTTACSDIHSFLICATCFGQQSQPSSGGYKNIKGRTDKTEEEASPLQYYSIK